MQHLMCQKPHLRLQASFNKNNQLAKKQDTIYGILFLFVKLLTVYRA